jgi:TRAP transporter TAXI family solute receptor
MLHQTWLLALFSVFVIIGIVGAVFYFSAQPTKLRITVGPSGSADARLVQALAQQFMRDRATIRLTPVIKDGPASAALAVDAKEADLAVVRRDIGYPQAGLAIAVLRENLVTIIVPAPGSLAAASKKAQRGKRAKESRSDKIESVEDLSGRRIGLLAQGPNDINVLNTLLKEFRIKPDNVTVVPLDRRNVAASLRSSPVDVIFALGPVASRSIAEAITAATNDNTLPTFLPITVSEAIAARERVFETAEIKAGVFGGKMPLPDEDIETISVKHYLVARKSLREETAADLTRLLFAARPALAAEFPSVRIEKPDTDRDAIVPAHPGAAAYLDNDQKTFFDKYSDFIYLGLMLMSGIGSGAAWLASYARADDRMKRLKVLERLLDIVKTARTTETLDELDTLRGEADEILNHTIRQAERNALDEPALMAFSLALDQAQLAISDRRAVLALPATPAGPARTKATPIATRPAGEGTPAPTARPAGEEAAPARTKQPATEMAAGATKQVRKSAKIVPDAS